MLGSERSFSREQLSRTSSQSPSSTDSAVEAAPQEPVAAWLESFTPLQRQDYLQQLYLTTEYSAQPMGSIIRVRAPEIVKRKRGRPPKDGAKAQSKAKECNALGISFAVKAPNEATKVTRDAVAVSKRKKQPKRDTMPPNGCTSDGAIGFLGAFGTYAMPQNAAGKLTTPAASQSSRSSQSKQVKSSPSSASNATSSPNKTSAPKTWKRRQSKSELSLGRGVTMRPSGKWQAQMYFAGQSRYIGVFDSREKAVLGYEVAREKLKKFNVSPAEVDLLVNRARQAAFLAVKEKFGDGGSQVATEGSSPSR